MHHPAARVTAIPRIADNSVADRSGAHERMSARIARNV